MGYEHELNISIHAVTKASRLCRNVQSTIRSNDTIAKHDRSPVTIADFGSQATISADILQSFPNDPIIGEEDASILRDNQHIRQTVFELVHQQNNSISELQMLEVIDYGANKTDYTQRYWALDPIDGTKGFLRGEQYAIALALVENGQVLLGVLGCPNLPVNDCKPDAGRGCLVYAIKGEGAFLQCFDSGVKEKIFVDSITDSRNARICESVEKNHSSHGIHDHIASALGITNPPYRIDSQCKYAVVARGGVSIYLRLSKGKEYKEKIWDHAAGSIIVEEAGGKVTDFYNAPLDFSVDRKLKNNTGIVATNGHLHQEVLCAISKGVGHFHGGEERRG
jgi:HAL2 family 3'(2'),5'-bisphosphate nucleotidase